MRHLNYFLSMNNFIKIALASLFIAGCSNPENQLFDKLSPDESKVTFENQLDESKNISILDYLIPAKGTKRFGGSSYGIWGTNIGLVVGIFVPIPLGFIIGPFVGAFIGELMYNSKNHNRALKAATGSFIGFLASSFMKFVVCMMYLGFFVWLVWKNKSGLF